MEIKTQIKLTEKDLAIILCDHFGIKHPGANVSIYKYEGDQRDPSYTEVIITGEKTNNHA
jgi:hypothetical protein